MKKIKVKGVTYYPVSEIKFQTCFGCELLSKQNSCLVNNIVTNCINDGIIFVKQNPENKK